MKKSGEVRKQDKELMQWKAQLAQYRAASCTEVMGAESQGSDFWEDEKSRETCLFTAIPPPSMKTALLSGEMNCTQLHFADYRGSQ